MKIDLNDWEKRRGGLAPVFDAAMQEGLIDPAKLARLTELMLGRGVGIVAAPTTNDNAAAGLNTLRTAEPFSANEESEAPRFIRGFHDILITIGVIIGLLGLGGLLSMYAIIPAVIVLAEILVRRQRLALPAVVLTIAGGIAVGFIVVASVDVSGFDEIGWSVVFSAAALGLAMLAYYWRYQVPLALASGLVALFAAAVLTVALVIEFYVPTIYDGRPYLASLFLGIFAAVTFATALRFDFADRERLTRRSDVAFWMHLAAAPAILYTLLSLIFFGNYDWFTSEANLWQAACVVAAVAVLMLIGIVLDRRAFVTSGLLSFGYAFSVLLTEGGVARFFKSGETVAFLIMLVVGVVVLSLGIGWRPLRRLVVGLLPAAISDRVPPIA